MGDGLAGIIGIVFFILILVFAFMAYSMKEKQTKLISSFALMIMGFIIMILSIALINPLEFIVIVMAIVGGLFAVFGGILMVPRKT